MKWKYRIWILVAVLLAVYIYRNSGESVVLTDPQSIRPIETTSYGPRKISFLRHWPIVGRYASNEIEPTFFIDSVFMVDLKSPEITEAGWSTDGRSFRITHKLTDKVTQTYFIKTDEVIKGAKSVTLRIKGYGTEASDALRQEDWYWVREFYDCEVLYSTKS